jgi:hypothetical protein
MYLNIYIIYIRDIINELYIFVSEFLSLLGPGHFKVYKTQFWMSVWCSQMKGIYTEWNMYFPNLGHNLCDAHAGHMKRY